MQTLDIFRAGSLFVTVKPDEDSTVTKKIMGESELTISFDDARYLNFTLNDSCVIFGENFIMNRQPVITKQSKYHFKYALTFVSEGSLLSRIQYLFLGSLNTLKETDFSLMGNADTFIDLLIANTQRIDNTWTKGEVIATDYKNLTFSMENCFNALAQIAQAFNTEFWIIGKTIHLVQKQNDTGYTFMQGKGKGLYEITPQPIDNASIITRLYLYGSDKNLPLNYGGGATRLRISGPDQCYVSNVSAEVVLSGPGIQDITFNFDPPASPEITNIQLEFRAAGSSDPWIPVLYPNESPIVITDVQLNTEFVFRTISPGTCNDSATIPFTVDGDPIITPILNNAVPYIEKNVDKYGVIEFTQVVDDIFPHRTGVVSAVDALNPFTFNDTDIDFDINAFLQPGITAKVVFNTGQLAGYQLEILSFNNTTKKFTLLSNKDETAIDVPSVDFRPAIGDQYVLVDIIMPQQYVNAAEQQLRDRANAILATAAVPQTKYTIVFDPVYLRKKNRIPKVGDLIWIVDDQLEIDRKIRVTSTSRKIINEFEITVELADTITAGTIDTILNTQSANTTDINGISSQLQNGKLFNNQIVGDLKIKQGSIIDPDFPTTSTTTGFSQLYVEDATGKIFRKV